MDLATREKTRVTNARGLDLRPQPLADGSLLHVSKRGGGDEIAVIDAKGTRRVLAHGVDRVARAPGGLARRPAPRRAAAGALGHRLGAPVDGRHRRPA
jgi:hypothetical protein